jgi:hypothetical protein
MSDPAPASTNPFDGPDIIGTVTENKDDGDVTVVINPSAAPTQLSVAQMMQMMQQMQLTINTLAASKAAPAAASGTNTPDQPGTPREKELQAELQAQKEKHEQERAELKASLTAAIFCGCSKGNNVCGRGPCKCFTGGKTCTIRCGCRAVSSVCCNDATPGVTARKKRQEIAAMEDDDEEALIAKLAAIKVKKAAKSVQSLHTFVRDCNLAREFCAFADCLLYSVLFCCR